MGPPAIEALGLVHADGGAPGGPSAYRGALPLGSEQRRRAKGLCLEGGLPEPGQRSTPE